MQNQHKITLTKKEFKKYIKEGVLRIEADFFVGKKAVKHCKAPLVFEMKNKGGLIELTFAGFEFKKSDELSKINHETMAL